MTLTPNATGRPAGPLPVVILGNDAVLAAVPAHPVQLAHACHAIGFHSVVPSSWGDELVAAATIREAALRARTPVVTCACPRVRRRLSGATGDMERFLFGVVAPPIAAARYVRRLLAPAAVHLTYVGACEAGGDRTFDAWILPADLLARFKAHGVAAEGQPLTFEGVVPPDRRRHFSIPGGAPSAEALAERGALHELVVLNDGDVLLPLAELLLAREMRVVDAAPALGCVCAGGPAGGSGRAAMASLEPPRATAPVLDARILVDTADSPRPPGANGNAPAARAPVTTFAVDVAAATPEALRVGMAITPRDALAAAGATGRRRGPLEFWRHSTSRPAAASTPALAPDQGAVAGLQPTDRADDRSTGDPVSESTVVTMPRFVVDRATAESALRRSPSHVRRVPPPPSRRRWPVAVALLLASAAIAAALVLMR